MTKNHRIETDLDRLIFNSIPSYSYVLDNSYNVIEANKKAKQVGIRPGKKCFESNFGFSHPCPWCLKNEVMKTGKTKYASVVHEGKVFNTHWVKISDGLILHYSSDITSQINGEKRLCEKRYRRLVNALSNYFYSIRIENKKNIHSVYGPGCYDFTGYSEQEFEDNPRLWDQITHDNDKTKVKKHFKDVLTLQIPDQIEHRIVSKDGSIRWIRKTPVYHYNENGDLISCDILLQNITAFKKTGFALKESEEKYKTLFETITDTIFIADKKDMQIIDVNEWATKMYGYSKAELMQLKVTDLSVDCKKKSKLALHRQIKAGNYIKHKRKNGVVFPVEINVNTMEIQEKKLDIYTIRDVTKQIEAEKKLKLQNAHFLQASKMVALGTLVSGVAHEINNPTNFITLNGPVLANAWKSIIPILQEHYNKNGDFMVGGLPYSEMKNHIPFLNEAILEGAERIKGIVEDLKSFSRKNNEELIRDVNINSVIRTSCILLDNMIKKSTKNFIIDYGPDIPVIKGNFQKLEQVIVILIQNACQALPNKKCGIFVSSRFNRISNSIEVIIKDEGTGISESNMPRIMEPFFTTKRDQGGTGMGLAVSHGIIKEHGGNIYFESIENKGTCVTISLPREMGGKNVYD